MKPLQCCMLALLAVVSLASFGVAQEFGTDAGLSPEPFLLVHKSTSSDDIVLGSTLEVTITVTNVGMSPAFNVVVTDILRPDDTEGHQEKMEVLEPGTSATIRYAVKPTELGNFQIGLAHVAYQTEAGNKATELIALSNLIREGDAYYGGDAFDDESFRGVVSVLTQERYDRLHARYFRETTAYIFLGVITSLFPYLMYRMKQAEVESLLRRAKHSK